MAAQELTEAVWELLQEYARRDPAMTIHSDLVIRKFPKVNEQELINAIGELILDGRITAKSSTVDAYGNATAFHIRVRGGSDRPAEASDPAAKKHITDQLMVLVAMFQSGETTAFATPIGKLAGLKARIQQVAPELVNDYILLMQTAVRAWLGRV